MTLIPTVLEKTIPLYKDISLFLLISTWKNFESLYYDYESF